MAIQMKRKHRKENSVCAALAAWGLCCGCQPEGHPEVNLGSKISRCRLEMMDCLHIIRWHLVIQGYHIHTTPISGCEHSKCPPHQPPQPHASTTCAACHSHLTSFYFDLIPALVLWASAVTPDHA
eukprot:38278-Pelagomonas_calceolata.AAC.1